MSQSIDSYDIARGGLQANKSYAILKTKYGNGYEGRSLDGSNYEIETYTLTFIPYIKATATALETILKSSSISKSNLIAWTPPDDTTEKKWYAEDINKNHVFSTYYVISCTLIRDYTV